MMNRLKTWTRKAAPEYWVILFFIIAYLLPLNGRPLFRPDEFRYAEIPREMLESSDWIVPRAAGMRYFEKPALGYHLIAVSFRCFGMNAFSLRLPGALSAGIAALFLGLVLKRLFPGDRNLPALGCALFLSFGFVWGIGTFAVLDMPLCAAVTAAVASLFLASKEKTRSGTLAWLLLGGVCAGIAFLLKGALGVLLPAFVTGAWFLFRKEWKKLLLYPWPVLLAVLPVVLPWSLAIAQREPDFWHYFLYEEHWMRFTGRTYDRKPQPFWYFLPFLLGGILPSGVYAFAVKWKREIFRQEGVLFLLFWAFLPFLLFSLSSCKLGTYILPCFPPVAGLFALIFRRAFREERETFSRRISRVSLSLGSLMILFGAAIVSLLLLDRFLMPLYSERTVFPLLTALLFAGEGILLIRSRSLPPEKMAPAALLLWGAILCCASFSLPDIPLNARLTEKRMDECLRFLPADREFQWFADKSMMIPAVWKKKETGVTIVGRPGEFLYALKNYPEYSRRQISEESFGDLLKKEPRVPRLIWMIRRKQKGVPGNWPAARITVNSGDVWMLVYGE